jgi:ubiquitin-conjugating enzyme E2 S
LTKIFHPNVSANGDICVNTLKKDWNADLGIQHVLQVIRCLLIVPFPESSLNDEAGKLFMENYEDYERRATLMTQVHAQKSTVTEDDASADSTAPVGGEVSGGTQAPKASATSVDSVAVAEKKKCAKKKKKNLKRL